MAINPSSTPSPTATHTAPSFAAALTLAAATAVGLACTPEAPDDDQTRAGLLMEAIDDADPAEAVAIAPSASALLGDYNANVCTLEARPAALLSVVDQYGEPLAGLDDEVTLLYTHRGSSGEWSEPREGLCVAAGCERWAIGHGIPGEYVVGAFACADHAVSRLRVGMTEDRCHVDTVSARLQLELAPSCRVAEAIDEPGHDPELPPLDDPAPTRCDPMQPESPSVVAMTGVIQGDLVIPHPPKELALRYGGADQAVSMDCLDEGCTTFASQDYSVAGDFRVRAELCGEVITESVSVEAAEDGCGVQTEWVGLYTSAPQCAALDYDGA
jgi:hypothetical protein